MENNNENVKADTENIKAATNDQVANKNSTHISANTNAALKSDEEALEKRKRRTHEASSTPDKNHVG